MSVLNAEVKLTVQVDGKGNAPQKLGETSKAAKDLEKDVKGITGGLGALGGVGDKLKESTEGLSKFGGGLAGIKMGMIGIPAGIGAIVAVVAEVGAALHDAFANTSIKDFARDLKNELPAIEKDLQSIHDKLTSAKGVKGGTSTLTDEELGSRAKLQALIDAGNASLRERLKLLAEEQAQESGPLGAFGRAQSAHSMEVEFYAELEKVKDLKVRLAALDNQVLGVSAEQLTVTIQQIGAAAQLNVLFDSQVRKAWLLLEPMKAVAGIMGSIAAVGAGQIVGDAAMNALFKPKSLGGGGNREGVSKRLADEIGMAGAQTLSSAKQPILLDPEMKKLLESADDHTRKLAEKVLNVDGSIKSLQKVEKEIAHASQSERDLVKELLAEAQENKGRDDARQTLREALLAASKIGGTEGEAIASAAWDRAAKALGKSNDKGIRLDPGSEYAKAIQPGIDLGANDPKPSHPLNEKPPPPKNPNTGLPLPSEDTVRDITKATFALRELSSVFSEALPGMAQYGAALDKIAGALDDFAKGNITAAHAVVMSVGAIAMAGAQQIKNERARAGVMALIETGLGFATMVTNPPESTGHFIAAGILALVAATGVGTSKGGARGGSAGSSSGASSGQQMVQASQSQQSTPWVININAPWFGSNPQEAAAGWMAYMYSAAGTGYGWAA